MVQFAKKLNRLEEAAFGTVESASRVQAEIVTRNLRRRYIESRIPLKLERHNPTRPISLAADRSTTLRHTAEQSGR
jgi:hypothetical protein